MTTDEIKQSVSMCEVVERYGLHPNRAGFISCPFHNGDRTPSMKIYKRDYHCHACGANGDIFSFVMGMEHCDFKTAFKRLGGSYKEQSDYQRKLFQYRIKKRKETQKQKEIKILIDKLTTINDIKFNRLMQMLYPPLSTEWCEAVNRLEYLYYKLEYLTTEKG
jgi:DNA primase